MAISLKKINLAHSLLEKYNGINPYIRGLKYGVFTKKDKILNDLEVEYIINNHDYTPEKYNKVVKIAKWFAEQQKEKWCVSFLPVKVLITDILGETENVYHVYLKYKQNMDKSIMCFIPKKALLDDLKAEDYNQLNVNFKPFNDILAKDNKKLYEHQETAVKFLLSRKKALLADDPGLGKSISTIVASIAGNFNKILVICPASLKSNWKKEISQFVPETEIGIVNSNNWVDKKYTIINYDILHMHYVVPTEIIFEERVSRDKWGNIKKDKDGNEIVKKIEKKIKSRKKEVKEAAKMASNLYLANFDLVIIDECHKLSDNKSMRYEVIDDFLTRTGIENVFLMSGTPMTNKPINLFHVLSLINHPVCDNYEYFVQNYCDGKQITNNYTQRKMWLTGGASNLDELMERIKTSYLRRLKKDIPGMVQKSIHQRFYDLTDDQRYEYDNLWAEYENSQDIDDGKELTKQLTEGIFLRQFVSNAMIPNTIELVNEFIDDGNKVFIACCFDDEISKLKEYYGDKAVIYKGGMSTKQKDEAERKFMTDDKTMVFIGNIIAAGVGLTLISSHICVFNSYDWVPGNNEQMMDRIHRIGQKEDVEVYYQLFSNTISEEMWSKIIIKKLNIESVIKEEKDKAGK